MFDSIDLNGDKSITVDELAQYLKKVQKQIKDAVRKLDRNSKFLQRPTNCDIDFFLHQKS